MNRGSAISTVECFKLFRLPTTGRKWPVSVQLYRSQDLATNTSDEFLSKDTRCESSALELQSLFRNLIATCFRAAHCTGSGAACCSGSDAAQHGTKKKQ
jgi:hypothetical protein